MNTIPETSEEADSSQNRNLFNKRGGFEVKEPTRIISSRILVTILGGTCGLFKAVDSDPKVSVHSLHCIGVVSIGESHSFILAKSGLFR